MRQFLERMEHAARGRDTAVIPPAISISRRTRQELALNCAARCRNQRLSEMATGPLVLPMHSARAAPLKFARKPRNSLYNSSRFVFRAKSRNPGAKPHRKFAGVASTSLRFRSEMPANCSGHFLSGPPFQLKTEPRKFVAFFSNRVISALHRNQIVRAMANPKKIQD